MTSEWLAFEQIFDGQTLRRGMALRIEAGSIAEIAKAPKGTAVIEGIATPGFVDLQVNGGGGVLLNNDPTPEGMAAIAAAHRRFGTVAILPTVITDRPEVLDQAVASAIAAAGTQGLIGLHIEGPHISAAKRGTHRASDIRPMDARTLALIAQLRAKGLPVMITVAPEAASADWLRALTDQGAVVSLGHTDASAEEVEAAIQAGAACGTHLFNAMSPMASRAPGAVGAILNSSLPFGIICDGHHVDTRMISLALKTAGPGRAFAVSDAMATVGGPDRFELYGQAIRLAGGRLINDEGALAGAHHTLAEALLQLDRHVGVDRQEALRMVTSTPANVIGRPDLGQLLGRSADDVLILHADLSVRETLATLN